MLNIFYPVYSAFIIHNSAFNGMASPLRLERVRQLLKEEIGSLVARSGIFPPDLLVTVIGATLSSDLFYATMHVSVYPAEKTATALRQLESNIWELQQELNKRLRMRPVPKIRFMADQTEAEAEKIENMLRKLE